MGGTRYVGASLVSVLREKYTAFVIKTFSRANLSSREGCHIQGDREDWLGVFREIVDFEPEIVIDFLCFAPDDFKPIEEAFKRNSGIGKPFHYFVMSSFFVYNRTGFRGPFGKIVELSESELAESDAYTRGKMLADREISRSGFFSNIAIFRLPFIFSADDYTGRFQSLCFLAAQREKAYECKNDFFFSMISRHSLVRVLEEHVIQPSSGIFDISNSGFSDLIGLQRMVGTVVERLGIHAGSVESRTLALKFPYMVKTNLALPQSDAVSTASLESEVTREAEIFFSSI